MSSTIDEKILLVKNAFVSLQTMTDEDYEATAYWQFILDNGGDYFAAGLSLFEFEPGVPISRLQAISIMRHVLIISYQYAWMNSSI